jgi:intracellular septation protein A
MKFLNILFAPLFVLLINYFELKDVVLVYFLIAIMYLFYCSIQRKKIVDIAIASMYVLVLGMAYYYSSIKMVKFIPTFLSVLFLIIFLNSHIKKKYMILDFTKIFYKRKLSKEQETFLQRGDLYWVFVMLINTIVHIYIVYNCSENFWAFYASIGWYGLFLSALGAQIIYGKVRYK